MQSPIRMVLPAGDATGYCPIVYENQATDMAEGTGPLFPSLKTDSGGEAGSRLPRVWATLRWSTS
ncbi:hypothetical protein T4C_7328 [Trichinella pseudospiralis]|uniref:Uncharacterized protein n=1 Tax=Trichinella pseudospiralis TaxID=6337 RepID=A0A0V1KBI6_TRIPS|nr:hypothetical protein T4C_7328 [Trichinella pseudospiralis]